LQWQSPPTARDHCPGQCVYEWEQSFEDVTVVIRPPEGVTAKHLAISIQSNKVTVGIKGEKPFIDCETCQTVDSSTSTWTLSTMSLMPSLR